MVARVRAATDKPKIRNSPTRTRDCGLNAPKPVTHSKIRIFITVNAHAPAEPGKSAERRTFTKNLCSLPDPLNWDWRESPRTGSIAALSLAAHQLVVGAIASTLAPTPLPVAAAATGNIPNRKAGIARSPNQFACGT